MKFAFVGTPEFASRVLAELADQGCRPSLVVSQPDRPRGRGRTVQTPPVVVEAKRIGLEYMQTEDINAPDALARLGDCGVSTLVVASFGQILRRPLLKSWTCLNIHTSLLPKYRGAAPIERALAAGEETTGVTIMKVTEPLDQGPWAMQKSLSLNLYDDAGSVARALAVLGAVGVVQVLSAIADGTVRWTAQEGEATYAHKLEGRDCVIDTSMGAKAAHDRVRSLSPSIGARARSGGVDFKIFRTWPYGHSGLEPVPPGTESVSGRQGALSVCDGRLFAGCAEGVVEVLRVQPAGRAYMDVPSFLRGYAARLGGSLEAPAVFTGKGCDGAEERA